MEVVRRPSWLLTGPFRGYFGVSFGNLGPILGHLGAFYSSFHESMLLLMSENSEIWFQSLHSPPENLDKKTFVFHCFSAFTEMVESGLLTIIFELLRLRHRKRNLPGAPTTLQDGFQETPRRPQQAPRWPREPQEAPPRH